MDFAISTRTPLQAILTSLQTSYRLLSRRGSQTVSIEQAQFSPSILRDIHGLIKRITQNGKMLLHRSICSSARLTEGPQIGQAKAAATPAAMLAANTLRAPVLEIKRLSIWMPTI